MKKPSNGVSRRHFLKILSAGAGAALLTGAGFSRFGKKAVQGAFRARLMLGTIVNITVHHHDLEWTYTAIEKAFTAIEKVDRVMSIHRPESDLSLVNKSAGNRKIAVDPSLCDVLEASARISLLTNGAYDVGCLTVMKLFGFYSDSGKKNHYPSDRQIHTALDCTGQRFTVVDHKKHEVGLAKAGAGVDLGSIGKGYAVDRAGDALKSAGIKNALIDIGGNILALGRPSTDEAGWRVAIKNPGNKTNPYFEILTLKDCAIATSGNYEQFVTLDGRRVGHLFDMRKVCPADNGTSVTVMAKSATLADALSTSAFLLGPKAGTLLAEKENATAYFHGFNG